MKLRERFAAARYAFNHPDEMQFGTIYPEVIKAVNRGRTVLFEARYAPEPCEEIIMQYVGVEDAAILREKNRSGGMIVNWKSKERRE